VLLGLWIGSLAEGEAHLVATGEGAHHSPLAEFGGVVSDLLGQAHGRGDVQVFAPILALFIPLWQHIRVQDFSGVLEEGVHRATNTNLGFLVQLEDVVVVTLVHEDLVLVLLEGILLLKILKHFLVTHVELVVPSNTCSFLHQLAHTIDAVLVKSLELDVCSL